MDGIDFEDRLAEATTRRTIVTTGVKLAYVAPVLAASFRLSELRATAAVAISGNACPPNLICGVRRSDCGQDSDGICSNVVSVNPASCICGNDSCGPTCSTDADCQGYAKGSICQAPDTGCCGQTCIAPCKAFDTTRATSRAASTRSGSNSGS